MSAPSLSKLLKNKKVFRAEADEEFQSEIKQLQLKMLRIQQGVWHQKARVVIVFEGFDASGKGGTIRKLTETLDPRGVRVYPIGAPLVEEQGKHWLFRFWTKIPEPGTIAIFDRSWYGRVLVERVENLTDKKNWLRAYKEINEFEKTLRDDGVEIIKIFLAITSGEQLKRFENRLRDPYKQWKLTEDDLRARKKWHQYVEATDEVFLKTHTKSSPWNLVAADNKTFTRKKTLEIVTSRLDNCERWMEFQASKLDKRSLADALKKLKKIRGA